MIALFAYIVFNLLKFFLQLLLINFHLIHPSGRVVNVEAVTSNHKYANDKSYYTKKAYQETIKTKDKSEAILKLLGKIKDKRDLFLGKDGKKYPYSNALQAKKMNLLALFVF